MVLKADPIRTRLFVPAPYVDVASSIADTACRMRNRRGKRSRK